MAAQSVMREEGQQYGRPDGSRTVAADGARDFSQAASGRGATVWNMLRRGGLRGVLATLLVAVGLAAAPSTGASAEPPQATIGRALRLIDEWRVEEAAE